MDFFGTIEVLRRHWKKVTAGLVLTLALTGWIYLSINVKYESQGVIVLTSPSAGPRATPNDLTGNPERINPLLAFDSSLTTTAQIITQILQNPATRAELGAGTGDVSSYEAGNGQLNGPFVFVVSDSTDEKDSQALVGRVLDRVKTELTARQRQLNAPESTFIGAEIVVQPTEPDALIGGKIRFAGAALVVGIIASLTVAFAAESIRNRRRPGDMDDLFGQDLPPLPQPRTAATPPGMSSFVPPRSDGYPYAPPHGEVRANGRAATPVALLDPPSVNGGQGAPRNGPGGAGNATEQTLRMSPAGAQAPAAQPAPSGPVGQPVPEPEPEPRPASKRPTPRPRPTLRKDGPTSDDGPTVTPADS